MFVPTVALVFIVSVPAFSQESAGEPYRVAQPAEGITCFSPGVETSPITTCVIETGAGLVVIDTGLSPTMAARTRGRIIGQLKRDDFKWVINTHSHFDHTAGNQAFSDATIVGHENVPAAMVSFDDGRGAWIERRHRYLERLESAAADAEAGSAEKLAFAEDLRFESELIEDLGSGYRSTPPTITFSDRLNLTVGDLDLELVWMGPAHTTSDILIRVPKLAALFTGDLFNSGTLGPAFYTQTIDPGRWLEALNTVLDGEIEVVIGGHGFVTTSGWVAAQRQYLGEVWRAVGEARASGVELAELEAEFPFDQRFSDLAGMLDSSIEDLEARHVEILREFWEAGL